MTSTHTSAWPLSLAYAMSQNRIWTHCIPWNISWPIGNFGGLFPSLCEGAAVLTIISIRLPPWHSKTSLGIHLHGARMQSWKSKVAWKATWRYHGHEVSGIIVQPWVSPGHWSQWPCKRKSFHCQSGSLQRRNPGHHLVLQSEALSIANIHLEVINSCGLKPLETGQDRPSSRWCHWRFLSAERFSVAGVSQCYVWPSYEIHQMAKHPFVSSLLSWACQAHQVCFLLFLPDSFFSTFSAAFLAFSASLGKLPPEAYGMWLLEWHMIMHM